MMAFPTKREKAFRARLKEAEAVLDIVRRFGCESTVAISPAVQPMLAALAEYDKNLNQVKP